MEGFFPEGRPVSYVLAQPKELNQGLPRTNLTVGQSGNWSQDNGISVLHPSHSARWTLRLNLLNETIQTDWQHHNVNELRVKSLKSNDTHRERFHLFFWSLGKKTGWWADGHSLSQPRSYGTNYFKTYDHVRILAFLRPKWKLTFLRTNIQVIRKIYLIWFDLIWVSFRLILTDI